MSAVLEYALEEYRERTIAEVLARLNDAATPETLQLFGQGTIPRRHFLRRMKRVLMSLNPCDRMDELLLKKSTPVGEHVLRNLSVAVVLAYHKEKVELYIKIGIAARGARGNVQVDAKKLENLIFIDETAVCSAGELLQNQSLYFARRGNLDISNWLVGIGEKGSSRHITHMAGFTGLGHPTNYVYVARPSMPKGKYVFATKMNLTCLKLHLRRSARS